MSLEGVAVCFLEGVQLLCLIDKAADACRYLQTYGEWNRAAWLAKVGAFGRCLEHCRWIFQSGIFRLQFRSIFLAANCFANIFLITVILFFMSINYISSY